MKIIQPSIENVKSYNIFYQNVRGLRTKTVTFYENVISLNYDVICITETWLNSDFMDGELCDERYEIFRKDRDPLITNKMRGGGVLLAAKVKYKPVLIKSSNHDKYDWICVKICVQNLILLIICVYFPPVTTTLEYEFFVQKLEDVLDGFEFDFLFIMGDWNIPEFDSSSNIKIKNVKCKVVSDLMDKFNMFSFNNCLNQNDQTLDLVLSNMTEANVYLSETPLVDIDCYHPPLDISFSILQNKKIIKCDKNDSKAFDFKSADFDKLYALLNNHNWLELTNIDDPDSACDVFYGTIYNMFEQCIPYKKIYYNNNNYPVWFNAEIKRKLKEKAYYHKKSKKSGSKQSEYITKFKELRSEVKQLIKKAHSEYNQNMDNSLINNPKIFWSYVNNKRKSKKSLSSSYVYNGDTIEDDTEITNAFGNFFKSVYTIDNVNNPVNFKTDNNLDVLLLVDVSEQEIRNAIRALNVRAAIGPDGIPGYFFLACEDLLISPLLKLFNVFIKHKIFPSKLKIGRIVPILKSGNKKFIENYRPVTILSSLSKILERVIYNRIFQHVKNAISNEQHGFVHRRSTVTNLLTFSHKIATAIDNNNQMDVVYTDLAKAFDTVSHKVLIHKLKKYGLDSNYLELISSYLRNRSQFVLFNNKRSADFIPSSGVPQGSLLGPLLFTLFVNDLPLCLKHSKCLMYADDVKLYLEIDNADKCLLLQQDLNSLNTWCINNQLNFNVKKCKVISYTKKKIFIVHYYLIGTEILDRVYEIKDLGVMFQSTFVFVKHINIICGESYRLLSLVLRISKELSCNTVIKLFDSLVKSKLEYAALVWNLETVFYSEMVEKVQKRLLRYIYYKRFNISSFMVSYNDQLEIFVLPSLKRRREYLSAIFIMQILNGQIHLPEIICAIPLLVPNVNLRARHILFKIQWSCSPICTILKLVNRLIVSHNLDIFHINNKDFVKRLILS